MTAQLIDDIITIPDRFYQLGNKSPEDLILDSRYLSGRKTISVEEVRSKLKSRPELVESWLQWSANKRTDGGWYFLRNDDDTFTVGYYASQPAKLKKYDDAYTACANFILNELDEFAAGKI